MNRIFLVLLFLSAMLLTANAQTTKTWEGYLADQMCGVNWKGEKGLARAQKHTKACALEESCAASGYGLFSGGVFVKFTDASSAKAKAYFEKISAKRNIFVTVTGTLEGEKIAVADIVTATPKKATQGEQSPGGSHGGTATCSCCQDEAKAEKHGSKGHACGDGCKEKN